LATDERHNSPIVKATLTVRKLTALVVAIGALIGAAQKTLQAGFSFAAAFPLTVVFLFVGVLYICFQGAIFLAIQYVLYFFLKRKVSQYNIKVQLYYALGAASGIYATNPFIELHNPFRTVAAAVWCGVWYGFLGEKVSKYIKFVGEMKSEDKLL